MTLKLEVGKTYIDGYGNRSRIFAVAPVTASPHPDCIFMGFRMKADNKERLYWYSEDGKTHYVHKRYTSKELSDFSLVKEYVPADWRWFCVMFDKSGIQIYPSYLLNGHKTKEASEYSMSANNHPTQKKIFLQIDITTGEVRL